MQRSISKRIWQNLQDTHQKLQGDKDATVKEVKQSSLGFMGAVSPDKKKGGKEEF